MILGQMDGEFDGLGHRGGIRLVFAGDVEGGAVRGRGAYERQPDGQID